MKLDRLSHVYFIAKTKSQVSLKIVSTPRKNWPMPSSSARRLREDLLRWMKATPLILAPVGATAAFEHGRQRVDIDGAYVSVFRAFSYYAGL
jgi:hypothetical protein